MAHLPPVLDKLVQLLARLPGVGDRSAIRLAFHLISGDPRYPKQLATALGDAVDRVRFCESCHHLSETPQCEICASPGRDRHLLCVVESIQDLMAFERTGAFKGVYHVLHGVLSPLKGVGPDQLRLGNLMDRIVALNVTEVIVATNTDVEGEATALYLARRLAQSQVPVTRIATGIPMGGDLEYIDQSTLTRALSGRQQMEL